MRKKNLQSTVYYVDDTVSDLLDSLPSYINRTELLRKLLNDDRRIRIRPRELRGYYENTRAIEVEEILQKKLPQVLKRCEKIDAVINSKAKRSKR